MCKGEVEDSEHRRRNGGKVAPDRVEAADEGQDAAGTTQVRTAQVYLVALSRLMCYLARAQLGALLPFLTTELALTSADRGHLMSRYASGYLLTQVPGGFLADRFGGYAVMAVAIAATALSSIAAPLLASAGVDAFGMPFFLMGVFQGAVMPAGNVLMARWILPSERSWASAITGMGACLGTLVINFFAPRIASLWGWRAVFHSTAWVCAAFLVAWLLVAASSPEHSRRVSKSESLLLQQAGLISARADASIPERTGSKEPSKKQQPPFNPRLFMHSAVWAVILCHCVQNSQQYFADWLPFFYSSKFKMDPSDASFHLTLIAMVEMPARTVTKDMPERLSKRGFSLLQCRKAMSRQGFIYHLVLCALLALLLGFDATLPAAYTLLFTLSKAVQAFHSGGYFANYLDLTRKNAGMLTGIGNTVASCAGVVVPNFVAHCLRDDETNWLPVIAGLIFLNMVAIALVEKGLSTTCLDDSL